MCAEVFDSTRGDTVELIVDGSPMQDEFQVLVQKTQGNEAEGVIKPADDGSLPLSEFKRISQDNLSFRMMLRKDSGPSYRIRQIHFSNYNHSRLDWGATKVIDI